MSSNTASRHTTPNAARRRPRWLRALHRGYVALLRPLFRATHSECHYHCERLWPHSRIDRHASGSIRRISIGHRNIPIVNTDLPCGALDASMKALGRPLLEHGQQRVHLIASGPSINDTDFTALAPTLEAAKVMGVNGAIALSLHQPVRFDYYCVTDTGFVRKRPDLVARIVAQDLLFFTTPIGLWNILDAFAPSTIACRFFLVERVGRQAFRPPVPAKELAARSKGAMATFESGFELGFSHDIRQGVFPGGTVAFEALQIMAWLNFKRIALHGIDLNNAATMPRFYESEADRLPTMLHRQLDNEILPSFRGAAPLLRARGVEIVNFSPSSALDDTIFPRAHWTSLLRKTSAQD